MGAYESEAVFDVDDLKDLQEPNIQWEMPYRIVGDDLVDWVGINNGNRRHDQEKSQVCTC
jgi:hypothetical protein